MMDFNEALRATRALLPKHTALDATSLRITANELHNVAVALVHLERSMRAAAQELDPQRTVDCQP